MKKNNEVLTFMIKIFVFGTKVTKQKRVTDEVTNEKKRIRYSAFLGCNNEKLEKILIITYEKVNGIWLISNYENVYEKKLSN